MTSNLIDHEGENRYMALVIEQQCAVLRFQAAAKRSADLAEEIRRMTPEQYADWAAFDPFAGGEAA